MNLFLILLQALVRGLGPRAIVLHGVRMKKDFYEILQVSPNADPEVIDAAYRRLALKYHPDVNKSPEAISRMRELNEAYSILRDASSRARYDRSRVQSARPTPPPAPAESSSEPIDDLDDFGPALAAYKQGKVKSVADLQKLFGIGYPRASRLMDRLNEYLKREKERATATSPSQAGTKSTLSPDTLFKCPVCRVGFIQVVITKHLLSTIKSFRCTNCHAEAKETKPGWYRFEKWSDRLTYLASYYRPFEATPKFYEIIAEAPLPDSTIDQVETGRYDVISGWGHVDTPLLLEAGEHAFISLPNVLYSEERTRTVSDGYSGMSLSVARGVRIYSGRGSSHPESSMTKLDRGTFCFTNKRYAFIGKTRTVSAPISKIVSVTSFADGISVARTGKQKIEYFGNAPGIILGAVVRQMIRELRDPDSPRQSVFNLEGGRFFRTYITR